MKPRYLILVLLLVSCGERDPESNPVCGISALAGATMVLNQLQETGKILQEPPAGLEGVVPARVVGYGTGHAIVAEGAEGLILGYEGQGFPSEPGFALALVEDSLDTFKGVLIYDSDPLPSSVPQLGSVSSATTTIPLHGMRVMWSAVSSERCPLFAPLDTTVVGAER